MSLQLGLIFNFSKISLDTHLAQTIRMALKNLLNGTEITIMCNFKSIEQINICVVGLGYVGLPLAVEFGKKYRTIGFDLNKVRIKNLLSGIDETKEVDKADLRAATHLSYTSKDSDIADVMSTLNIPTIDQRIDLIRARL